MLDLSPSSRLRPKQQGFTLIELLMVIAVILILAGITFGISRGVQNAQARAQAKAELATISQAIEQFKSRYGDYPLHASGGNWDDKHPESQMLLYALTGRLKLEPKSFGIGVDAVKVDDSLGSAVVQKQPVFLDHTKFSVQYDGPTKDKPLYLLDPWGNPYRYWYKYDNNNEWDIFGYYLFSIGSDGQEDISGIETSPRTGVLLDGYRNLEANIDNIYVGE